jgi:hypothetical protein
MALDFSDRAVSPDQPADKPADFSGRARGAGPNDRAGKIYSAAELIRGVRDIAYQAPARGGEKAKPGVQRAYADARAQIAKNNALLDFLPAFGDTNKARAQGASFGFADEIGGAINAGVTGVRNALADVGVGQGPGYSAADAYEGTANALRGDYADTIKRRPVSARVNEVAGGAWLPVGKLAQGGNLATTALRSGALGGATGYVAGFGSGEGDFSQRNESGKQGALFGAAVGAAAPAVVEGATTLGRAANNLTGQRLLGGPTAAAAARLREALTKDGATPQQIRQGLADWHQNGAGSPVLMNLAGPETKRLIRFAASRDSEGWNAAVNHAESVAVNAPRQGMARAAELTPEDRRPASVVQDARRAQRTNDAREQYRAPYGERIDPRPVIGALEGQAGGRAIGAAHTEADALRMGDQMQELGTLRRAANPEPDAAPIQGGDHDPEAMAWAQRLMQGQPLPTDTVSLGTLDRIKVALNQMGEQAQANGQGGRAAGYFERADEIDRHLADNSDAYRGARDTFAGHSQHIEGVDLGKSLFRASAGEGVPQIRSMTPNQLAGARIGFRQALQDAFSGSPHAGRTFTKLAREEDLRQIASALYGEQEAARLVRAAQLKGGQLKDAGFINPEANSKTFSSGQDEKRFNSVLDTIRRPVAKALEKLASGLTMTDAEAAELVRMGLLSPESAQQVIGRGGAAQAVRAAAKAPALTATAIPATTAQELNRRQAARR